MTAFVSGDDADVTVLIVTYNSIDSVGSLIDSLRTEAANVTLRVVVIDNASTDGTPHLVSETSDVVLVHAGGNVGYAAAINQGMAAVGRSKAVLILNPDASVTPGCVSTLLAALSEPGVVATVPMLTEEDGSLSYSLRREPRLCATAVDAAIGSKFPNRPAAMSETVRDSNSYNTTHDIEWATGAAVMIDTEAAAKAGPWDERFFLYSEETDYFRRLRAFGRILYVHDAAVVHTGGGSGSSQALEDLLTVNKVRYVDKYHGPLFSCVFHTLVALSECMRAYSPQHRATLRTVLDRRRWHDLPKGERPARTRRTGMGAIIIPAHNEAAVIDRTLEPLVELAREGVVEVIVVCNGCTDDTARVARLFPDITVLDIYAASKTTAMNAGDDAAVAWPRVYLDADVVVSSDAVVDVLSALSAPGALSGRPAFEYDTSGAGLLVRRYYAARQRIPEFTTHLWGAGCYAMTESGHRRVGAFPDRIADDVVVDAAFEPHEKTIVDTDPVTVRTPRTARALLAVLSRNYRGNEGVERTTSSSNTLRVVIGSVRGPVSLLDSAVYVGMALLGRRAGRRHAATGWARDDTSRAPSENRVRDAARDARHFVDVHGGAVVEGIDESSAAHRNSPVLTDHLDGVRGGAPDVHTRIGKRP
ncbi:MAG: glycosyltransferase family 2 protein [Rhodococcus sp. (in: high G+C Gram-positive bacteria)]